LFEDKSTNCPSKSLVLHPVTESHIPKELLVQQNRFANIKSHNRNGMFGTV